MTPEQLGEELTRACIDRGMAAVEAMREAHGHPPLPDDVRAVVRTGVAAGYYGTVSELTERGLLVDPDTIPGLQR